MNAQFVVLTSRDSHLFITVNVNAIASIEKLMQSDCIIGSIVSLINGKMFHVTQTPHEIMEWICKHSK